MTFALYVHWPFCKSKCPYCDFNSHVRQSIDEARWRDALLLELERTATWTGKRNLTSIFFGGGTPSLMDPKTVESVIDKATQLWATTPSLEITLEANPNSVEASQFKNLKASGVNRISVGIQALNDVDLKALGRLHSTEEAMSAIKTACSIFDRVSFDLIYARPHQTLEAWKEELAQALTFNTEHLSLYQLTIEPGTAFATLHARGELKIPDSDLAADFYELTQEMMEAKGLPAYEISNHARVGAECQHNLVYWRYQDYAGVGPGAHGRVTINGEKIATQQKKAPETWLDAVFNQGNGNEPTVVITSAEQAEETLMMGLRLQEGVHLPNGITPFHPYINQPKLSLLIEQNLLTLSQDRLTATKAGRQCLNSVLQLLLV